MRTVSVNVGVRVCVHVRLTLDGGQLDPKAMAKPRGPSPGLCWLQVSYSEGERAQRGEPSFLSLRQFPIRQKAVQSRWKVTPVRGVGWQS